MLCLSYTLVIQAHLPVCLPCYDLSLLMPWCLSNMFRYSWGFEEGDGRCVRALGPGSVELSILSLLLNPPLVLVFIRAFVCVLF